MRIEGIVKSTIFRSSETGYTVLRLDTEDGEITCVGPMPIFNKGDSLEIDGDFTFHDTYGEQIQVKSVKAKKPSDKKSIISFLSSGNIDGIGKKTADLIYKKFGNESLDILYEDPDRLLEISGIGKKKLKTIKKSIEATKKDRETLLFLEDLKLSPALSRKVLKQYGENTILQIKTNPYSLISDIRGVGFTLADQIARNMQIASDNPFRISAGLSYLLENEAQIKGSTCMREESLIKKALKLLGVEEEKIRACLLDNLLKNKLYLFEIEGENLVYTKSLYKAEKEVAFHIAGLKGEDYIFEIDMDDDFASFSKDQVTGIKEALSNMLLVITGGPGTGKTTIINAICQILDQNDLKYFLAAPTGRAAKRMQEASGREASTIHRLIGLRPDMPLPEYNEENPLPCDYLIVDEVSMVDIYLAQALLKAISDKTALILVGDSDQLASVGPGNFLKDLLATDVKSVRLKKIFRQAGLSNIVVNAHRINEGTYPLLNQEGKDFFFIDANEKNFMGTLEDLVKNRLPSFYKLDPIGDIQILSPTKKGLFGVTAINSHLQRVLNPREEKLMVGAKAFQEGDRVMQVRNNYDLYPINGKVDDPPGVYNGDMGIIQKLDLDLEEVQVLFYDGRLIKYRKEDLGDLELSYCVTIHKSQGSEFDCVVIPMMPASIMLLNRNLLYTGVTRAKKLLILIGKKDILKTMVDNTRADERLTKLSYRVGQMGEVFDGDL